ncbi:DUF4270 domain-containing protein [Bacteroides sp. 214]|uniref:DUF4270 domain-containing protein n=1 Tax=Bacteroides sp. 214 TaxID=2302935 RepID=UPI0013D1E20D|nr:DUF4270 domain-containing protein [Bacteroides sp. 214]NDW13146.1 DUF4270 domain-containing protein [Bacteroides sp. 214]
MKAKNLWVLLLTVFVSIVGCDDNTGSLGLDMLPPADKLTVDSKTFEVSTKSALTGAVFAKTNIGYIGKFSDPDFGYYETSFLTQLNCVDSLTFPSAYDPNIEYKEGEYLMAGDSTYLTELVVYYDSYFGDSLNACRMSVYELNKDLDKNHYTNINPEDYYDESDLLGRKAYSAYDTSISDSLRATEDYVPYVRFVLSKEKGEEILRLNREHPEYFYNSKAFVKNVLKGLYIKSDYGDGTILYANSVALNIVYNMYEIDSLGGIAKDTLGTELIYRQYQTLASTKEVIQANRFSNSALLEEKVAETDWTYLKSPAGIHTEVTLPILEIAEHLKNDTLNTVKLVFDGHYRESENQFSMSAPSTIMMIRESKLKDFFEKNEIYDNISSYIANYQTTGEVANQYIFNNITNLVNTCIREKDEAKKEAGSNWDEAKWIEETQWNKVVLIPVVVNYDSNKNILNMQNDMRPGYIKLKGGANDKLQMKIYYTYFQ